MRFAEWNYIKPYIYAHEFTKFVTCEYNDEFSRLIGKTAEVICVLSAPDEFINDEYNNVFSTKN